MEIGRRQFLEGAVAGAGGILLGWKPAAAEAAKPIAFDPYELVPLGKTKLKVSRVGVGTGTRGGMRRSNQTKLGPRKLQALLRGAYERGIRWFDTADTYGSHPHVAGALKGIDRDKYVIVSKMWWRPRGGIPEPERPPADVVIKRFLKELNTDHIDLVQLHCVTSPRWPAELRRHMDALHKLKEKGIIRAHGVSCHTLPALAAAAGEPWVDAVHARINAFGTRMDGSPSRVAPVLKRLHGAGKGVIGMKIIGEGGFRNSDMLRDTTLRYVLGLGCVDIMTVGFESTAEIDDFAARVRRVPRATPGGKRA